MTFAIDKNEQLLLCRRIRWECKIILLFVLFILFTADGYNRFRPRLQSCWDSMITPYIVRYQVSSKIPFLFYFFEWKQANLIVQQFYKIFRKWKKGGFKKFNLIAFQRENEVSYRMAATTETEVRGFTLWALCIFEWEVEVAQFDWILQWGTTKWLHFAVGNYTIWSIGKNAHLHRKTEGKSVRCFQTEFLMSKCSPIIKTL